MNTERARMDVNWITTCAAAILLADWRWRFGLTWLALRSARGGAVRAVRWAAWQCRRAPATFGNERWLSFREARSWGLLGSRGLIVGRMRAWWGWRYVRFADQEGSMIVFAPMGSGKGVGIVVPNLLTYPGAVICTDPKGENLAVTARQRRTMGPVFKINLSDPHRSDCFNPMDMISRDDLRAPDDCRRLAELLMPLEAKEGDSHWRKRSVSVLAGFLLHVIDRYGDEPTRCTIGTADALLSAPMGELEATLKEMMGSAHMVVRTVAARMLTALDTEEGLNILSNISKGTEIWGEGRVLGRLSRESDFRIGEDVIENNGSLFLIVPEDMQTVYAPFMRVMVGLGLQTVTQLGKRGLLGERPLFMLDEAAALGTIPELEDGMAHLRSYARAVLIFQDLGQVKACYYKGESVISNASCQVFMGVNDEMTSERVSRLLGEHTVETRQVGVNSGADTVLAHHENRGRGEAARRLLQPSEVLRLDPGKAIVFMRGLPHPLLIQRVKYYAERAFDGLWDLWRSGPKSETPTNGETAQVVELASLRVGKLDANQSTVSNRRTI